MTTDDRSLERAARTWVDSGPTRAPDRAVEAALLRVQTIKQDRDLRIPWRLPDMNPVARLASLALVGVVAVGVALFALRPAANTGDTQTQAPPVSMSPAPPASDSAPSLAAYRSAYAAICASLAPITDPPPSPTPAELAVFLQAVIDRGNDEVAAVEALQAPPALLGDHLAAIQTTKDVLTLLAHEKDLVEAGKLDEANTVDEATGPLNALREQFAAKWGLSTECP